jgi:glycosyltransferase involved in cell wall biosynthesis
VDVGIDGRSLAGSHERGVARYTRALIGELSASHPQDRWRIFVPGRGRLRVSPELARANVTVTRHPLPGRALFGAAALAGRPRLDRLLGGGLDVVWAPAPAPLAVSRNVPLVLSVHDLSFELRPRDFTAYERLWHRLARPRRLAARATRVVAVSGQTRTALRERWGLAPERLVVIRNGVSRPAQPPGDDAIRAARARYGLNRRYFLFVGALEPRKAPDVLVEAFARARAQALLDVELALVGEGRLASTLGGSGVRLLGHVSPEELPALYAGAIALVLPSWLEGFGMPPTEALALGTPVIVSDLPVFAEILGDGALRVPPGDVEALTSALVRVATGRLLRRQLVIAGAETISRLTWKRAADLLYDALVAAAAA